MGAKMNEEKKIEVIEWYDDRFYKVKNAQGEFVYLPSVTTKLGIIIDSFLLRWYGDLGTERAQWRSTKAKEQGSKIHEAAVWLWQGKELLVEEFTQEEWIQLMRFLEFYKSINPVLFGEPETIVYDLKNNYAGTLDMPVWIKGGMYNIGMSKPIEIKEGFYVGDLKTGKSINQRYHYQTAAYAKALEKDIEGTFILWTGADTKSGWKMILRNRTEIESDFQGFLEIARVWDRENANTLPKQIEMPVKLSLGIKSAL